MRGQENRREVARMWGRLINFADYSVFATC